MKSCYNSKHYNYCLSNVVVAAEVLSVYTAQTSHVNRVYARWVSDYQDRVNVNPPLTFCAVTSGTALARSPTAGSSHTTYPRRDGVKLRNITAPPRPGEGTADNAVKDR